MNDLIKNNPLLFGIFLIIIGGLLVIYYFNSIKKVEKNKSILAKTSNMNLIGLILLLFILGVVTIFRAL